MSFQQEPHSRRGGSDEAEGPLVDVVRLCVGHILDLGTVHLGQAVGGGFSAVVIVIYYFQAN